MYEMSFVLEVAEFGGIGKALAVLNLMGYDY